MANQLTVNIAGEELTLITDDIELVNEAVEEINRQVAVLKDKHKDLPKIKLIMLAALNIVEQNKKIQQYSKEDRNYINSQLTGMIDVLNQLS